MNALQHIEELRKRIIILISCFALVFIIGLAISRRIIEQLTEDIIAGPVNLVVLSPTEYFLTSLKTGFYIAVIIATPIAVHQIFQFAKPALEKTQSKMLDAIFIFLLLMYTCGLTFAYTIFLPLAIYFIAPFAPQAGLSNMWSISSFVHFCFITVYTTGLIFQIPLIMIGLAKLGIVTSRWLRDKRKYCYVAVFIIAAIVTPGVDAVTQIIVALPMILLFELGNLFLWTFRY
jgi:sec-independent protein translocase protein TatC